MNLEIDGRQFQFGDLADEDEARRLVRELLAAEQELAEAQAAGDEQAVMRARRGLEFAEGDVRMYQDLTRADYRPRAQAPEEAAQALTAGERAIVAELRELRRAVLADRVLVPDSIGEMTRSRADFKPNDGAPS